jgi:hypothetical protein
MTTAAQMARLSEYSHGGFSLNPASLIEAHMERSADESTSLSSGIYGGLLRMFSSFASGSGSTTGTKPRQFGITINIENGTCTVVKDFTSFEKSWRIQQGMPRSYVADEMQQSNDDAAQIVESKGYIHELFWLKDTLDIGVSGLAELFGVTRKTVYDWFDNSVPRRGGRMWKIALLRNILEEVDSSKLPLLRQVWDLPVGGEVSLLDVVRSGKDDAEEFRKNLRTALQRLEPTLESTKARNSRPSRRPYGEAHTEDLLKSL